MPKHKQQKRREIAKKDWTLGLEVVHPRAAGIDIGAAEHYVAVPPHLDVEGKPVRSFQAFTADLNRLTDWLQKCGIETVALQSTGVYWMALYDILEQRGFKVFVVNAQHTKNLPGRKSDVQECQWLLQLHVYGLLRNSFRPSEEIRIMRSYWRLRQEHVAEAATCIQRMQKALIQMNAHRTQACTVDQCVERCQRAHGNENHTGDCGGRAGRARVGGPLRLRTLPYRDPNVKASEEEIAQSLEGTWKEEHLFALQQQLANYDHYQKMMGECDRKLHQHLQGMEEKAGVKQLPPAARNKRAHAFTHASVAMCRKTSI